MLSYNYGVTFMESVTWLLTTRSFYESCEIDQEIGGNLPLAKSEYFVTERYRCNVPVQCSGSSINMNLGL